MFIDLNTQYVETGQIHVPRIIDADRVVNLRCISEHCLSQWRCKPNAKGEIPSPGSTVMRHLNHPGYFPNNRQWLVDILDFIADPKIIAVVQEVLGDEVLFRTISLFMNPLTPGSDGNWHRDCQFFFDDFDKEKAAILKEGDNLAATRKSSGIQLQVALIPSNHSQFVPGSHRRWDTEDELYIRRSNGLKYATSNLMPGKTVTHQEPGDAAAFHHNGIHRGNYRPELYRRTLMLTYTGMAAERPKDEFSDQPWCAEPGYLDGVKPETKAFFERFIGEYRGFWEKRKGEPKGLVPVF
ncbi:MAG: hypothetical protein NTW19_08305 [Planctomycetota bacterium]|nr:hypothetical protein [Planctomycetota bacterium]